jgi:hypothetical protein
MTMVMPISTPHIFLELILKASIVVLVVATKAVLEGFVDQDNLSPEELFSTSP